MDPAFAANTAFLAKFKKPKRKKAPAAAATAGLELNERALSRAAAEAGIAEPDEDEPDWYNNAVAAEAATQHGSSRRLHNGRGSKSSTAGSAASESVVVNTREQA